MSSPLYDDSVVDRSGRPKPLPLRIRAGSVWSLRQRIRTQLEAWETGRTSWELARAAGFPVDGVWRELCEMERLGLVARRLDSTGKARWQLVRP